MRRCVESGRSELECLGEGMKVGLKDLAGGDIVSNITGEKPPQGLRLTGAYSSSSGNKLRIAFSQDKAIVNCGSLNSAPYTYSVERTANQISIQIPISPKPILLAFRTDNTLAGPSDVVVNGLVPIGHGGVSAGTTNPGYQEQTHTATRERQIDAAEAQNDAGTDAVHQNGMEYSVTEQVSTTTYEPAPVAHYEPAPMAPKTERCTAGIMQGNSNGKYRRSVDANRGSVRQEEGGCASGPSIGRNVCRPDRPSHRVPRRFCNGGMWRGPRCRALCRAACQWSNRDQDPAFGSAIYAQLAAKWNARRFRSDRCGRTRCHRIKCERPHLRVQKRTLLGRDAYSQELTREYGTRMQVLAGSCFGRITGKVEVNAGPADCPFSRQQSCEGCTRVGL